MLVLEKMHGEYKGKGITGVRRQSREIELAAELLLIARSGEVTQSPMNTIAQQFPTAQREQTE